MNKKKKKPQPQCRMWGIPGVEVQNTFSCGYIQKKRIHIERVKHRPFVYYCLEVNFFFFLLLFYNALVILVARIV